MNSLVIWVVIGSGLAGTIALFAGTLVGWKRHPAHVMMCIGALLSLVGLLAILVLEGLTSTEVFNDHGRWQDLVEAVAALMFFGGWLLFGPAYLWAQMMRKRERTHADAVQALRSSMEARN